MFLIVGSKKKKKKREAFPFFEGREGKKKGRRRKRKKKEKRVGDRLDCGDTKKERKIREKIFWSEFFIYNLI